MHEIDYKSLASRLSFSLAKRNINIPNDKKLYEAVLDYFEDNDFRLINFLFENKKDSPDWHYIIHGDNSPLLAYSTNFPTARSKKMAIASVITLMDENSVYPDRIQNNGGVISFYAGDELIIKIGKIQFKEVNPSLSERCSNVFSGIRRYGDDARLAARLKKIPGLQNITHSDDGGREYQARQSMISTVENIPVSLELMLRNVYEVKLKHSMALEVSAEMFDVNSWNILKAMSVKSNDVYLPIVVNVKKGNHSDNIYFKSNADAVAGFANMMCMVESDYGIVPFLHGGCVSFNAAYIAAYPLNKEDNGALNFVAGVYREASHSLNESVDVYVADEYLSHFNWVDEVSDDEIALKLRELLSINQPLISRMRASAFRLNDDILALKKYVFSVERDNAEGVKSVRYLRICELTSSGFNAKTKKQEVIEINNNKLIWTGDGLLLTFKHETEYGMLLKGLTKDDALALSEFAMIFRVDLGIREGLNKPKSI